MSLFVCMEGAVSCRAQKHKLGPGSRFTPANRAQDLLQIQKPGKPNLKYSKDMYSITIEVFIGIIKHYVILRTM